MNSRGVAFERAVRIEMLRAQAAIDRHNIADSMVDVAQSLDPRLAFKRLLPGGNAGLLTSGLKLMTRYPYLLSSLISARRFRRFRWLSLAAVAVSAWAIFSRHDDQADGS